MHFGRGVSRTSLVLRRNASLTRISDRISGRGQVFGRVHRVPEAPALEMKRHLVGVGVARFGALLPRFSPRQADLLMVIGTVNHKLSPVLKRVYEQMSEPKWVMAFGACAASGGFYDNYATVQGIDRIIPVDVYVPGCPPRPEAVLDGLMELQKRIAKAKQPI